MQCPLCKVPLQMTAREGIEIDYCPQCRGVWLDRGELDKIIERSVGSVGARQPEARPQQYDNRPPQYETHRYDEHKHDEHKHYDNKHHGHKKKRESFLEDLFDFG